MQLTILQKPGPMDQDEFNAGLLSALSKLKGDLSVAVLSAGFSENGWARISIEGADSEVFAELVSRQLGVCATDILSVEKHGNYQGLVAGLTRERIYVDIGIEKPSFLNASIPLSLIRAQLADGKTIPGKEILEQYCLTPPSRISLRITRIEAEAGLVEACLSEHQLDQFEHWINTGLERLVILHALRESVQSAIRKSRLERDIIGVEPITLTSQSAVCKLGTNAIGLLPKLGRILRQAELKPFIPNRITARCRRW